ncbi:MAG: oligosaccharide flippase family protein [Bacteroidales bacterium]|nr:oligosaccharide flippase family protein [Bacteroidales bacterium]
MQKKFLTNLALILLLNFLVKPFWILGIDRTVQNVVGTEYGFYFYIFNFTFLFNILLDLGITNFNNRNIAQNNQLLNKHFSRIVILKLLLSVLYIIVTFSIALILGFDSRQLYLLAFLAFNQFLISFIFYLRSNIAGLLLLRTDSFLSVLDRVLMIMICSMLLWGHVTESAFKIEWFVYSQTIAYFLTALIALAIVVRKSAFKKLTFSYPFIIMIVKKSFPFALLVLLMTFYNRVDSVLIGQLLKGQIGFEQITIYASAFRLLDAVNMIAFLFAVLLLPIFSRMIKKMEAVDHMVKLSFTLIITIAVIVSLGSFFYSFEIMDLLYVAHVEESVKVFRILMFGFVAISTSYIVGTLLTANGSLKQLNIIAGCSMVISLVLNFVLIPKFMAVGSAWASVTTQFIAAIAQVIVAQAIFKFKINYRFLATVLFFIIGVFLINMGSKQLHFSWMINFLIMLIASMSLAFLLRLISLKSFIHILKTG